MKVLVLCNTVYQIIVATQLRYTLFEKDSVDIIISDHMNFSIEMFDRLQKKMSWFWTNIYYFPSYSLARRTSNFTPRSKLYNLFFQFSAKRIIMKLFSVNQKYDIFLFANPDLATDFLFRYLRSYNRKIVSYIYEDGLSTYCVSEKYFLEREGSLFNKMSFLFGITTLYSSISGIYLFRPELMMWNKYEIIKIPYIDTSDSKFINLLNITFDYYESKDNYNKKIIFFEESYFKEGYDVGDVELLESISQIIGKNNIMIKIHPRNKVNRFKKLGYDTNENTAIPWEIIALNTHLDASILITIASGAVFMPYLLLGINVNSIILMNLNCINVSCEARVYYDFISQKILNLNQGMFYAPRSLNELMLCLTQLNRN